MNLGKSVNKRQYQDHQKRKQMKNNYHKLTQRNIIPTENRISTDEWAYCFLQDTCKFILLYKIQTQWLRKSIYSGHLSYYKWARQISQSDLDPRMFGSASPGRMYSISNFVIHMIGIIVFSNHWVDAIVGGPKVPEDIQRSQICLTPKLGFYLSYLSNFAEIPTTPRFHFL